MLHELRVENLLLLDRAELRLASGLNVLTGETGAGKTLLAHALDLLLGGRARAGIVRAGAEEAYVEGTFSLPPGPPRPELLPAGADEIVLARRVWPDGRTRAYVCGRSATVADLRELGSRLLAFYGQHEHRRLMLATAQLDILDAHCGPAHAALRRSLNDAYERVRRLQDRTSELAELAGARERELDLAAFELQEIEAVAPSQDEADELAAERDRLRHLEALRDAVAGAAAALSPDDTDATGVSELLARAARPLEAAAEIDPRLRDLATRLTTMLYEAQDLAGDLRGHLEDLDASPGRLAQVEERLAQFARLERKHGGSIADVLAHAERCRRRREELMNADVALESARDELARGREERDQLARKAHDARERAAPALAEAVRERLHELAMPEARFEVALSPRADGCGPRGTDTVELLISPNAGLQAAPLRAIASGGELSRVMLALLSVAHSGQSAPSTAPMLVFDEIDAGIGGHTARAVGEHLRSLARGRQILCITHLPQVASLAERHFTIGKDSSTVPPTTRVTQLAGEAVVAELVRMLGAGQGDRAASQHARELLKVA
jgi:DNA repair protein RecN (Recombination protein N)